MIHPQHNFVEGKCLELQVLDVEQNCIRVYVKDTFICQYSKDA